MKLLFWCPRVLATALAGPLAAQAAVDLSLKLDVNFGHNSNLFRVDNPSNTTPGDGPGPATPLVKSSTQMQSIELGMGIPLGSEQTRLILTTSLGRMGYSARPDLDHSPTSFNATLPWRFTDRLEGEVSAGYTRTAYAFDDFYPLRDITRRNWTQATISLLATPSLSFPVTVSRQSLRHEDQATHIFLDFDAQRISASGLYRSTTGSNAQLGFARSETSYPGRAAPGATTAPKENDNDVFMEVNWQLTPITLASLRWANRERSFDNGRDATRTNLYRLGLAHTFSAQLQLDAQLWRLPSNSTQQGILDGTSTGRRIGMRYLPNPKWDVAASWQQQTDRNDVFGDAPGLVAPNPDTTNIGIRGRYHVDSRLTAYLDLGWEKRVRRQTANATQQIMRIGVEYRFENIPGSTGRNRVPNLQTF
ncbi:MAG: hypothetical protein ACOVOX_10000 [Burkholderiaceae bacterium]